MELKVIDYKTADLAYEEGFPQYTDECYVNSEFHYHPPIDFGKEDEIISAPTQELLRKWLRDEHNIHIQIRACEMIDDYSSKVYKEYDYKSDVRSRWSISFKSYEQALEEGLKEALKHLLNKKE